MNKTDLAFTPALEQAQLIQKGTISPLELTQLYLERIDNFDSQLGSFYTLIAEQAIADAQAKTQQLAQTQDKTTLPPFFGIPTAIKDIYSLEGVPTSCGVAALKNNLLPYEDAVVTRIKQAGFIILGKTAASQLGSLPYTEPPGFPPTRNPWNPQHTSGGSSGGAATAVAAGFCPLAPGSDGGGSIRIPAACCGLVGLKPARGRISNAPIGDYQNGIATHGPLARTVADAAALLDVMSGYTIGDPYWLPDPETSFLEATKQNPHPLRIAFSSTVIPSQTAVDIYQQAIQATAQTLTDMGHMLTEACPDLTALVEPFKRIWQTGASAAEVPRKAMAPVNAWLASEAGSGGEYLQAVAQMQIISRQIVAFFQQYDVLLLPVLMHPPMKVGEWQDLSPAETVEKVIAWMTPNPLANATGLPAIALPTGKFDSHGLPIGIQLIGGPAAEATVIALGAQLERANPWLNKRPPSFAS